ncbi:hypothetical protein Q1J61_08655 [Pseudomonas putida]|uniref:hypothetical protein n=1 Tax=Pseudomonas putida TaxID=303 RepID=UPI0034D60401
MQVELQLAEPADNREAWASGELWYYRCKASDLRQKIRTLTVALYQARLDAFSVPLPDPNDEKLWAVEENFMTGRQVVGLTTAGEHAALAIIREAKKERRETKAFWLAAVTGLGGIAIGVISVLTK